MAPSVAKFLIRTDFGRNAASSYTCLLVMIATVKGAFGMRSAVLIREDVIPTYINQFFTAFQSNPDPDASAIYLFNHAGGALEPLACQERAPRRVEPDDTVPRFHLVSPDSRLTESL